MPFPMSQRKLYLLAVAILALAVVLAVGFGHFHSGTATQAPVVTASPLPTAAVRTPAPLPAGEEAEETASAATPTMTTVAYYQDNYGYLVPVAREIPQEEGVAKATLSLMVKSLYNDMEAARLGLRTVLPEGTRMELDITRDKIARIDLSAEAASLPDAQSESVMVNAIVQTLTQFDTVDAVEITVEGQKLEKLPNGTRVSGQLTRGSINLESTSLNAAEASSVTLYFPSEDGTLLVPVTRLVAGNPDIDTAVLELAKGPRASGQLEEALPVGTGLISVKVVNGVAQVNFTEDFIHIVEESDGGRMALKALMLTCANFDGVRGVQIFVEGKEYDPGLDTMAIPTLVNTASALEQAIATQSSRIFE